LERSLYNWNLTLLFRISSFRNYVPLHLETTSPFTHEVIYLFMPVPLHITLAGGFYFKVHHLR
jgi:hypothetical protein